MKYDIYIYIYIDTIHMGNDEDVTYRVTRVCDLKRIAVVCRVLCYIGNKYTKCLYKLTVLDYPILPCRKKIGFQYLLTPSLESN